MGNSFYNKTNDALKILTNQPPSVMVMQFDQRLYVASFPVSAVHEFPGLLETKSDVVATSSPLPTVCWDLRRRQSDGLTTATWFWCSLEKITFKIFVIIVLSSQSIIIFITIIVIIISQVTWTYMNMGLPTLN